MYEHPTGRQPKLVHIICSGATSQDWHRAHVSYQKAVPTACEVWSLNKSLRTFKADLGFVLDDLVGEYNKCPEYFRDIVGVSSYAPIITTTLDKPAIDLIKQNSVSGQRCQFFEYPIGQIRNSLGEEQLRLTATRSGGSFSFDPENPRHTEMVKQTGNEALYFKNSVPMILAYAYFIGVEVIYLWGADYSHPVSGYRLEADQPNAEYWVGYLRGRGVKIVVPSATTLLRTNEGRALYGYGARQPKLD